MRAFGAGRKFGGVLRVVLVALDAELASAVAWFAAIHAKAAGVVFFCAGCDVLAGHETEPKIAPPPSSYSPTGELSVSVSRLAHSR